MAPFTHGGYNTISRHIFKYKMNIQFLRDLILRNMCRKKNAEKNLLKINRIIYLETIENKWKIINCSKKPGIIQPLLHTLNEDF